MHPIRTETSNFVYRSLSPDTPDMPLERVEEGHIRSVWELMDWERLHITQGANIELNIFAEPIPPVSLQVTGEGATWVKTKLVAERFLGADRQWHVGMVSGSGAILDVSKGYAHEWRARLAQRRLKRILPAIEISPS